MKHSQPSTASTRSSPPPYTRQAHPVDGEASKSNAAVDCGWGRVIFAQTFAYPEALIDCLRREKPDRRDIAFYSSEPHVALSLAPQEIFLDPSHTYRWRLEHYRALRDKPRGFEVRGLTSLADAEEFESLSLKRQMLSADPAFVWAQRGSRILSYFFAVDNRTRSIIAAAMGIDHAKAIGDTENGSSLWGLCVDPQCRYPGAGEAVTRFAAEHYLARGRAFIDFSVLHDNESAIALYERLGCERLDLFALKVKKPHNESLYLGETPEAQFNPYAAILIKEARLRGIDIEALDSEAGYFALRAGGRRIVCRESLTELTTAVAMSRCDDKLVTRRVLARAGLNVPEQITAGSEKDNHQFLKRHGRVVVKPAQGEQGAGITVGVETREALKSAIESARSVGATVLLEELVEGQDLRVIVIDYRVVAAAVRLPAMITGNGKDNIRRLIERWSRRRMAATGGESRVPIDGETERCVRDAGYGMDDCLPEGLELAVRKTANLHTGGTIHDVTHGLSSTICQAAVEAARALEIPVVGLDFLVPAVEGQEYVILEANERPGLANHEPQPTAQRFVDLLFPETARAQDSPPLTP